MNFLMNNNMKTKMFFMIIVSALFAISCNSKKDAGENEPEVLPENTVEMNDAQIKTAGITLGAFEDKVLNTALKVNGLVSVTPQNLVSISAVMGGYVKSISLVQGSPVAKGQVVATLENSAFIELQQNYLEDKSKLEYAEADYTRQKELYKENVNSAKTYQLAVSEYKTLKTSVYALAQKLKLIGIDADKLTETSITGIINIVSPIAGYVKTVSVNTGKYVDATDVIAEIVNTNNMMLELTVFEKDISKVSVGQKINFNLPDNYESKQTAVIYQVGKTINEDKTVKVYATIEGEINNLLPGMYVNASIETKNDSVKALPSNAVLTFDDKDYIFIYHDKKKEGEKLITLYKLIEVVKGVTEDGYTEVTLPKDFDLKKSKIVIKGAYNLLSAMKNAGDMAC
jgi:membrane fusion protein, heavy metal efflux system